MNKSSGTSRYYQTGDSAERILEINHTLLNLGHDFNNMLSVIFGNAEAAMRQLGNDHPAAADLQDILDAAEQSHQ